MSLSAFAEDGIVLLNKLAYYNTEDKKSAGSHFFGDKVKLTGNTQKVPGSRGEFLCKEFAKDDKTYLSSSYFLVGNATEGVIADQAYIYKMNDLSSATSSIVNPLTFLAVDVDTINNRLVKVSYLTKAKGGWSISSGWVKKELISFEKDDWGAAIKYHLATQQEDKEARDERLSLILKRHKGSLFTSLVQKMLDEGHLRVVENDLTLDENFAGTDNYLSKKYNVTIYEEADILSEVLFTGETNLKLNKRSLNPITFDGVTDYMYHVSADDVSGWIHGLE